MPSSASTRVSRLAVLISGSGTNLGALLARIGADPGFGGEVVVVGCDRPDAPGLGIASAAGLPTVVHPPATYPDRPSWEAGLQRDLEEHGPDALVLAGFLRVLSGPFLAGWPDRVLNTHPSLLPAFPGAHAVRDALAHGVKLTGCTVHLVDEEVDHGPIVAQRAVEVAEDDTVSSLQDRIKAVEHDLLPTCVKLLCSGRLAVEDRHVSIQEEGP